MMTTTSTTATDCYLDDLKNPLPPYLRCSNEDNNSSNINNNTLDGSEILGASGTTVGVAASSHGSRGAGSGGGSDSTSPSKSKKNIAKEADAGGGGGGGGGLLNRVSSLGILSEMAASSTHSNTSSSSTPSSIRGRYQATTPRINVRNTAAQGRGRSTSPPKFRHTKNDMATKVGLVASHAYYATINGEDFTKPSWRLRDRMKTVGVGLIMALNVGTDPPDVIRPHPCAKLQCWMDPSSMTRSKAKEAIGERLEQQYARWQQQRSSKSLKYRKALDPTVEDVRALCLWLRRQARHERILLHYNGHGVPRPTSNGEIWVFDKNHTEYIPLSVSDLRQWAGKPTIVVLDCSSAGILIPFLTAAPTETPNTTPTGTPTRGQSPPTAMGTSGDNIYNESMDSDAVMDNIPAMDMETAASHWVKDTIVLCPTSGDEWLPMHPDYPADIFTACLTTPIEIGLRWFVRNNRQSMGILLQPSEDGNNNTGRTGAGGTSTSAGLGNDLELNIPGSHTDRKTPLGELNWIFTAVTDSIAWNMLPKPLFQRLFRQDLMVASMFRNFLLADRIMRSLDCTPTSYPPLPHGVADHPLWMAWDLACETSLFKLMKDGVLGPGSSSNGHRIPRSMPPANNDSTSPSTSGRPSSASDATASSISSPFFFEQLTAFEVWLDYAEIYKGNSDQLESPEQLPVVLQVLLFQVHRVRALALLRRFLLLGPWAVNLALSLGIFPYVLKLLQSPDYKSVLLNIWASILKFDPTCQVDLVKDKALPHFIQPLAAWAASPEATMSYVPSNILDTVKQRTLCAFALAASCFKYSTGQIECLQQNLHVSCASLLASQIKLEEQQKQQQDQMQQSHRPSNDASQFQLLPPLTREWLCICIGNLVQACPPAQAESYNASVHVCLMTTQQKDSFPNVRAAATYALGCLLEYASAKSPSPSSSSSSLSSPSLSSSRVPSSSQVSTGVLSNHGVGNPAPINLGAQAFSNPNGITRSSQQPFRPGPQIGGAQAQQLFLPQQVPGGVSATGLLSSQLQPNIAHQPVGIQALNPNAARGVQVANMWPGASQGGATHGPILTAQPGLAGQAPILTPGLQLGQGNLNTAFLQQSQPQMLQPQTGQSMVVEGSTMTHHLGPIISGQPIQPFSVPGTSPPIGLPLSTSPQTGHQPSFTMPMGFLSPGSQPQQPSQQPRRRPTLFEDRRRVEFDLQVMESMVRVLEDGSPNVRYEAVMVFSNFVEKYLQALLVVVEDSSRIQDFHDLVDSSGAQNQDQSKPKTHSRVVSMPKGVNQMIMDRFTTCWKALRQSQHSDPHPKVSEAANTIVRVVHEIFLDMRMEMEAKLAKVKKASVLIGIEEEIEQGDSTMDRVRSDQHLVLSSPDPKAEISRDAPHSDGKHTRLPSTKLYPIRRSASEHGVNSRDGSAIPTIPIPGQKHNPIDRVKDKNLLPKSELFLWKRSTFRPTCDELESHDMDLSDPLNPADAARSYQQRRNHTVKLDGRRLADHFEILQPKRPDREKSIDILLADGGDDDDDKDDDDKVEELKSDLKLRERQLLRNTGGARMISMVRFHTYENALIACDDEKTVSVWDYEKGDRKSTFSNKNPAGSRMTTSFWINESSSSHLFVGCDDGSARIWKGVVAGNGDISERSPDLLSAFFAVPDVQTGQQGRSGLICEWQQKTGTLIAGGNAKSLRCWDLAAEKCCRTVDTETEACVTTLTTAWDEDNSMTQVGYRGMGPEIVVAGTSEGLLKVFDIRMPRAVAVSASGSARGPSSQKKTRGRKVRYPQSLIGHRSWIVETSFSCFGGQNEVLSGSVGGDLRAWDLRMAESVRAIEVQRSPMTALSVHPRIPIAASGSHAQFIKIMTLEGETLQVARFHEKMMPGHRIGPVSCLEFHKQKLILAAGSSNSLVSIRSVSF